MLSNRKRKKNNKRGENGEKVRIREKGREYRKKW